MLEIGKSTIFFEILVGEKVISFAVSILQPSGLAILIMPIFLIWSHLTLRQGKQKSVKYDRFPHVLINPRVYFLLAMVSYKELSPNQLVLIPDDWLSITMSIAEILIS